MSSPRWSALTFALSLSWAQSAAAFTLETAITEGCHERITLNALRGAPWPDGVSPPIASREDLVLAENLPFLVPAGLDRWSMSVMVGVRDNDLEGYSLSDLPELAAVHGAIDQSAHCLRSATQDFDQGDNEALSACRLFIHHEIDQALGASEVPELEPSEEVQVALRFQRQHVRLSRYAFHMGRALHALQDSYAHSFRAPDSETVVGVLNYIDAIVSLSFNVSRDGHAHMGALDECTGSAVAVHRATVATESSSALLKAVAAAGSRAERVARIDAVLDQSLRYTSGCGSQNEWCGAFPETQLASPTPAQTQGCSLAPGGWLLALAALLLRSRRPQH